MIHVGLERQVHLRRRQIPLLVQCSRIHGRLHELQGDRLAACRHNRLQQLDLAKQQYDRCVELDPSACDCRIGLGVLALTTEDYGTAQSHFSKATEVCPSYAQGHYNLCYTQVKMGRCREAVQACTNALAHNPDYIEAKDNLGQAYECVAKQDGAAKEFIAEIQGTLETTLEENGIEAEIKGRTKSIYSIHQKMKRQRIELDQVYDFVALRVLVKSIPDCYAALGVLHNAWRPVPGRVKDFIAMPRPNGYRSLHTSVIGDDGHPFEV